MDEAADFVAFLSNKSIPDRMKWCESMTAKVAEVRCKLKLGNDDLAANFARSVTVSKPAESESDDSDDIPLEAFEYKGNNYLKDPFQEVYTAEGKMEWVGTYNGKKIVKGDMPERVKKFIEAQD